MKKGFTFSFLLLLSIQFVIAQPERWQQRVQYKMDIDFDVKKHQFNGNQTIKYTNIHSFPTRRSSDHRKSVV